MLKVSGLSKYYHHHLAIDDISFELTAGEVVGFLGPNGAGKSTLMNILAGYLAPSSGQVHLNGQSLLSNPQAAHQLVGYLPEVPPLYTEMTVYEYLLFIAQIRQHRSGKQNQHATVQKVMQQLDIAPMQSRLLANLSKGYKQRVGIAATLIGKPKLLIWDEPTAGLDPQQLQEVHALIHQLKQEHTLLLSSHMLREIEDLCDRILLINQGKLITIDSSSAIKQRFNDYLVIEIEVAQPLTPTELTTFAQHIAPHAQIDSPIPLAQSTYLQVRFHPDYQGDSRAYLWQIIQDYQWRLLKFNPKETTLEESFLKLIKPEQEQPTS